MSRRIRRHRRLQGEAAQAEIHQLRAGLAKMVPCAGVVAGPCGGVAVASGVTGAGQDERAHVGREFAQSFVGASAVLHAEDVVNLKMAGCAGLEAGLFDSVLSIVGHGLGGDLEDGRLVHVVPEAGNAFLHEVGVERAPPVAGRLCA